MTQEYAAAMKDAEGEEVVQRKIKAALTRFSKAFNDKLHHLWQIFHKFDSTNSSMVDKKTFEEALRASTKFVPVANISDKDVAMIADYYFPEGCKDLNYAQFIGLVETRQQQ